MMTVLIPNDYCLHTLYHACCPHVTTQLFNTRTQADSHYTQSLHCLLTIFFRAIRIKFSVKIWKTNCFKTYSSYVSWHLIHRFTAIVWKCNLSLAGCVGVGKRGLYGRMVVMCLKWCTGGGEYLQRFRLIQFLPSNLFGDTLTSDWTFLNIQTACRKEIAYVWLFFKRDVVMDKVAQRLHQLLFHCSWVETHLEINQITYFSSRAPVETLFADASYPKACQYVCLYR